MAGNGGPTQTMALLAGSPALGAGSNAQATDPANANAALTTDQRGAGFARIVGTVDMGAYETQPFVTPVVNPLLSYGGKPVLTGTFDQLNAQVLQVTVDGTSFTLGTNSQLVQRDGSGTLDVDAHNFNSRRHVCAYRSTCRAYGRCLGQCGRLDDVESTGRRFVHRRICRLDFGQQLADAGVDHAEWCAQLVLTSLGPSGTATITSSTQFLVGGTDTANYGNSSITFPSGTFANQTWTKLDLPSNFTNPLGAATHVIQNGAGLTFVNKAGGTSAGHWTSPTQVVAVDWGNDVGTVGNGRIAWSDGSVWTESVVIPGTNNGAGTTSIATPAVTVTDYVNSVTLRTAHIVQTGTSTLVFINAAGAIVFGSWTSNTQVVVPAWNNDVGTFTNGNVSWSDGAVWNPTNSGAPQITVTDYTNPANGKITHLIQNGTQALVFVNAVGVVVMANWISPTKAMVPGWGNDVATFGPNTIHWSDGNVWNQNLPQAQPVTILDYINQADGKTTHVVQNGATTVAFVNGAGTVALATMTSPTQATVAVWNNDVATFNSNGTINWSDGSVWNPNPSPSARLALTEYTNPVNGRTAYFVQNGTSTALVVNGGGAMALAVLNSPTNPTQATVAAWGNDVATFSGGNITWSDGATWSALTTALPPLIAFTDTNGAVTYAQLLTATTLIGRQGALVGVTGTRQDDKIIWSNGEIWDNFDLRALNALFEMATGYP